MTTIAHIMGCVSYDPCKEAVYGLAWLIVPPFIKILTFEPTRIVSKIDHIRERLFETKTRFLQFTQTNTLTKYTWAFLKSVPYSLGISTLLTVATYYLSGRTGPPLTAGQLQCVKFMVFTCISFLLTDEEIRKRKGQSLGSVSHPIPPRRYIYPYERRGSPPVQLHSTFGGWKDTFRPSQGNPLAGKIPLPRSQSLDGVYKDF